MTTYYGTITSKRQITIPAALCRKLRINPGDRVAFRLDSDGRSLIGHVVQPEEVTSYE